MPARHALFFSVHVRGAESASIGLASHPPVIVHREDVIERNKDGSELRRLIGQGDPIGAALRSDFITYQGIQIAHLPITATIVP